jgi:predicted NBD/HSP70 family sugar kinase
MTNANMSDVPAGDARGLAATDVRRANLLALLRLLRDGEPHCTPDLGLDLQLDPSTVTRLLGDLRQRRLVRQVGVASSGTVGRPRKVWRLASRTGAVVGLNIAVDQIYGVISGLDGRVLAERKYVEDEGNYWSSLPDAVRAVCDDLVAEAQVGPLLAAGAAVTGAVDTDRGLIRVGGATVWVPEVKRDYPLGAMLQDVLGCPVLIGNDANVAAMASFRRGIQSGELEPSDSLVYVLGAPRMPLWWGGMGYIVQGRLHTGSHSLAGELFYRVPRATAAEVLHEDQLRDARLLRIGDQAAAERLRPLIQTNVSYIVSLALGLDPKRVVFGGVYARLGACLEGILGEIRGDLARMHPWLEGLVMPEFELDRLWPATLELGAMEMALDRLYCPRPGDEWDLLTRVAERCG